MSKRIALIAFAVLVLTFTGLSCKKETSETPANTDTETSTSTTTTQDLSNIAPATVNATFSANYTMAQEKATVWKGDAKLVLVSVKLPKSLEVNNATESYAYGSASDPDYWWNISIAEKTGKYVRAIIPKADYLGTAVKPIDTKFWKINYDEAFQIAEASGGKTFRQNNSDVEITTTLQQSEPKGWLWWLVEYKTPAGSTLKVRINPNDKTVVDELGNIIGSSTTTGTSTTGTTSGTTTSGTGTSTTTGAATTTTTGQ